MKLLIYDTTKERYLSEDELERQYFLTGESKPYIRYFRLNLVNLKVQMDYNNDTGTASCCSKGAAYAYTDRFLVQFIEDNIC